MGISAPQPMVDGGFYVFAPNPAGAAAGGRLLGRADTWDTALAQVSYYAQFHKADGRYRILPAAGWGVDAVGFGVVTAPSPTLPGQMWLPAADLQVSLVGTFGFTVTRGGGSAGAVAVDYTITLPNGTPAPVSGTINFANGEVGSKAVNVTITGVTAAGIGQVALSNPRSTSGGLTPTLGIATTAINVPAPAGFAWDDVIPKQILTVGTPYSVNLNDFINPDAAAIDILNGNAAAMNLTLNPTTKILSGTPTAVVPENALTFRAIDVLQPITGADQEYLTESSKPGVFYKNNFDFSTRAELMASAASVRYGFTGVGSGDASNEPIPGGTYEKVGLDFTRKLTGRASLLLRFRGAHENLTQAGPSYSGSFGGIGVKGEGPPKDVFFMRYVFRWNPAWLATKVAGGTVTKQMTIFGVNTGFSNGQHGFCTYAQNPDVPGGWLVTSSFQTFKNRYNGTLGLTGSNYGRHPFMDAGPQSNGALNDTNSLPYFMRRFGALQYTDVATMADKANYPCDIKADREYVVMHKIDKVNDEIKMWFAEYGRPPVLFSGRMDAGVSSAAQYTGFQCLFRPDDGTNQVIPGGVDLDKNVDQILVSDDVINFPGGHVPPYAGAGQRPPGYPYLGSFEVT